MSFRKMDKVLFEIIDQFVDLVPHLLSLLAGIAPGFGFCHVVVPGVELNLLECSPELKQFPVRCVVTFEQHLSAGAVQMDGGE